MTVRRKQIRSLAERLLMEHRIHTAPVPVDKLAESLGIRVQRVPTDDSLSGFLYRESKSKAAVIGVNSNHHPNRQNFTVAHELGHYLLHNIESVHVDRRFDIKLRSGESSKGTNLEEMEANLFAAEILMPKSCLEEDVAEIGEVDLEDEQALAKLAKKYRVSTQALIIRLGYLGYVQL